MDAAVKRVGTDSPSLTQDNLHDAINLRLALLDLPLSDCDSGGAISGGDGANPRTSA